ncbi:MAG: TIGR00269 family protein [Candidatus Aenigmatarchaeota archaeon]
MKCKCGNKGIFFRRYEGRYYCKKCFIYNIEKKFRSVVNRNKLIKKNDKIAVGLSGGKDSSVLLYLLFQLKNKLKGFDVFALTIDEGINDYRNKGLIFAKKLTKKFGIKHYIFSFKNEFGFTLDELTKNKIKSCTYCGVLRRYILNKKARELGANKLAVGHNLDDEAQSIILNFIRGDLLRFQRLGAFPIILEDKKFVSRIKPLRDIPEKEITAYAILKNIKFFDGECPYSFDNMRRDLQTLLNNLEEKYPGTKLQIVNFYDRIKPFISKKESEKIDYCIKCGEPSSLRICKACELLEKINSSQIKAHKGIIKTPT